MKGRRLWLILAAVAIVAVAIVAVFAVGGRGSTALADAAQRMSDQNARIKLVMGGTDRDGTYAVSGTGVMTADNSRGTLFGQFQDADTKHPVIMDIRMIRDDSWVRYIDPPNVLPPGIRWLHLRDRNAAPQTLTPSEFADFLAHADEVEKDPHPETIRGKETTHYIGRVDLRRMADKIGGETEHRIAGMLKRGTVKLPVEAWIGPDGLPARLHLAVHDDDESIDVTIDMLEYGVSVNVEPPPRREVIGEKEFDAYTEQLRTS